MAIQAQMYSKNLGYPFGGSQDLIDNGCGSNEFSFNLQQQQQYLQLQQQKNQKLFLQNSDNNNNMNMINNNQSMGLFSQFMATQMEKQKQDIDTFISLQNERLRLGLLQQRKQQLQSVLKRCESKAQIMLSQKDEEIAKAFKRKMELEDFLRKIEIDNQTWQRLALENESMVVSLNKTIEHIKQQQQQQQIYCFSNNNGVEDSESCCENGKNRGFYKDEENNSGNMICKNCNSGNSCVILLPCRHLCACKDCEVFLDSCPVCKMEKKASIDVLF